MAPSTSKKADTTTKKAVSKKPAKTAKHVALNFTPIEGSQKAAKPSSLPKFTFKSPTPEQSSQVSQKRSVKGKERAAYAADDELWVDKYAPETQADLAVHPRKVKDVQQWLSDALTGGPSGKLKKYRRLLALTGPAGTGKTATLRVLAKEMDFEILEWRGAQDERFATEEYPESLALKFELFLTHSTRSLPFAPVASSSSTSSIPKQRIILLEELPNILHHSTRDSFHAALQAFVANPDAPPVVMIISDSGTRGFDPDGVGGSWRRQERWDVRSVIPLSLLSSPYMMEIQFNPSARTYLQPALTRLLERTHPSAVDVRPSPQTIDLVIEASMGDIRSAVMSLQFACRVRVPEGVAGGKLVKKGKGTAKRKKGEVGQEVRRLIESVTRQEQALVIFHVLGKILYNKRFGDDPDENEDVGAEISKRGTFPMPQHLTSFYRRPSKVDPNVLHADSPVDTSLLAVYLHQNYTNFCETVDEMGDVMEWISYSETCAREDFNYSNAAPNEYPHQLLTRGILLSLPSPVPRLGGKAQRLYKSEYWEHVKRERETEDALRMWAGSGADVEVTRERGIGVVERAWGEAVRARAGLKVSTPRDILALADLQFAPLLQAGPRSSQLLDERDPGDDGEVPSHSVFRGYGSDDEATGNDSRGKGDSVEEDAHGWLEDDDIVED